MKTDKRNRGKAHAALLQWGKAQRMDYYGPGKFPDSQIWQDWVLNPGSTIDSVNVHVEMDEDEILRATTAWYKIKCFDYRSWDIIRKVYRDKRLVADRHQWMLDRALDVFWQYYGA